jgi:hypothetical protein
MVHNTHSSLYILSNSLLTCKITGNRAASIKQLTGYLNNALVALRAEYSNVDRFLKVNK